MNSGIRYIEIVNGWKAAFPVRINSLACFLCYAQECVVRELFKGFRGGRCGVGTGLWLGSSTRQTYFHMCSLADSSTQHLDYTYKFPTRRSQQVAQQTAYNMEVSILSGIAKYVGFPAAPNIDGVRSSELDADLQLMGHESSL